ncbi:MAG: MBL fold metallo-hydrolase [Anaerolineae bacterium]|nr:MBL fold metallo-hydrolase [Anaerolineae bacterium]
MREIAPGVFIETDYSLVTVGAISTTNGWVCIDTPPYPRDARKWKADLQSLDKMPIRYVINTDHHRDRILGNVWFEAPVVAHEASADVMFNLKNAFLTQSAEELNINDADLGESSMLRIVPPQISYSHSLVLYCGERVITLNHRPGATAGSTWVTLPDEKVIFVGDTIVTTQHPYMTDGVSRSWLVNLSMLREDRYTGWTVVPGRGNVVSPEETAPLSEYLRQTRKQVAGLVRADRARSDVSVLIPDCLSSFEYESEQREDIQRRIKAMLEAIYEELRANPEEEAE